MNPHEEFKALDERILAGKASLADFRTLAAAFSFRISMLERDLAKASDGHHVMINRKMEMVIKSAGE